MIFYTPQSYFKTQKLDFPRKWAIYVHVGICCVYLQAIATKLPDWFSTITISLIRQRDRLASTSCYQLNTIHVSKTSF